ILSYSAAWALGRCGSAESILKLQELLAPGTPLAIQHIAEESLRALLPPEERDRAFREGLLATLPGELAAAVRHGPAAAVLDRLRAYLEDPEADPLPIIRQRVLSQLDRFIGRAGEMAVVELERLEKVPGFREALDLDESARARVLEDLYGIDNDHARPALLEYLRVAPFQANTFRFVRRIFKAAHLRRRAAGFGLLPPRFETTKSDKFRYFYISKNLDKLGVKVVERTYTGSTRSYLRARVWRTLNRLGRLASPEYVRLAEQVLIRFSDDDAEPICPP